MRMKNHGNPPGSGLKSIYMEITGGTVACSKSNLEGKVSRGKSRRRDVDRVRVFCIAGSRRTE